MEVSGHYFQARSEVPLYMEPLIKDPLRRGQPLYKGQFIMTQNDSNNTFLDLQEEDNLSIVVVPMRPSTVL